MTQAPQKLPSVPPHAIFWLIVTTFLWGGSFVFNKIGFREIPPITFLFFRFSLAALIMGGYCIPRFPNMNRHIVRKGLLVGLALCAANFTFVLGVSGTSVTRAGFLNNLFVLIVPLLSLLIWRKRVGSLTFAGIMLATLGLFEMASGGEGGFSRGDLFSVLCAFFISTHIIVVSALLREEDVYLVTFVQFLTVAVVGGVLSFIFEPSLQFGFGAVSAGALFYCAIFPTVICFTLQNTYQRYTTPTQAGLIYTLDPVWTTLGGIVILGERLTVREWVGCALIFAAVVLPMIIVRLKSPTAPAPVPVIPGEMD